MTPFLMRVLHRLADAHEQLEPLFRGEVLFVAVLRDGDITNEFHDEVRASAVRGPGVVDSRDVRMACS